MVYLEQLDAASMSHGLIRVETRHRDAHGDEVRGEDLLIPAERLAGVIESLQAINRQLSATRPRAQAQAQAQAHAGRMMAQVPVEKRLWAFALQIYRQHGVNAQKFVADRLASLASMGDAKGVKLWQGISARLEQLHSGEVGARQ